MDKHDRFIAINQTLPGLEEFLKVVLGSEPLSESANRQRIEFLKRLENVSRPPSLPPRPANLSELFRARLQGEGQPQAGNCVQDESSVLYRNDRSLDPIEFASQQRELSRAATTIYKTYIPQRNAVVATEEGSPSGGVYIPRPGNATYARDTIRDSLKSSSSAEDDIYERLSLKGISPEPTSTHDAEGDGSIDESFVFPSPPKTPQDLSPYGGARGGSFRASGGKGKLHTGWFKKEAKVYDEVYVSNLREPVIKGYLKDVKTNKRRWCVLQGDRLHIFKNQEDPAIMIIDLPDCNIGIDDKKKISYSFRLNPAEGPGVSLAIEEGSDLSPWMKAIMAAAVRRSSVDRPTSPLEGAFTLEEARAERLHGSNIDGGIQEAEEEEGEDSFYEAPVDYLPVHGELPVDHSTPTPVKSDGEEDLEYNAPLPPLPDSADNSSSDSSSDEDESVGKKDDQPGEVKKKKIYDEIPPDLLAELLAEQNKGTGETSKSQDSICDDGSANDQSRDFTDSHSEHSGNVSKRHSYNEMLASDDTGSSEPREEKTANTSRKRTSTVLSNVSMESVCSDVECTRSHAVINEKSGFKVKRRRRLVPAEAELQFLQDPNAMHSGILYQKRRLGVWKKRYCKIVDNRFKSYRNPGDWKPSLDFPVLGYDISLIDNKECRKSYCIKISHPSLDTFYFATDSRVSVERWIEVLSLVATGRVDIIAPYPPYFCGGQSGDELVSRSRESLLSSEGRLSDDDSADTLDDLDPPSDKLDTVKTPEKDEKLSTFITSEMDGVVSADTRNVETSDSWTSEKEVQPEEARHEAQQQASEEVVKERVHKKRKEKPSDKEGTKTPSTMSPPHSMFISETASGEAKPEAMNEEYSSPAPGNAKENNEESSSKKDRRRTETLKKKQAKMARGYSLDHKSRSNVPSSSPPEPAKGKFLSIKRKNSQSFAHLVTLFDKEGRFGGYLTEVKYKKFGTTHLRRWCVVKNGVLNLYNNETEETPQAKLSLVDMWMTGRSDEARNKFAFALEDKEGNETILQTFLKEEYQKWMGVLELFTELRVERPYEVTVPQKDPVKKTDSSASEEGDGLIERGVQKTKTARTANKPKEEIYSSTPGKVRTSLRMKISQRVNVRDIFRKSHSSYDMECATLDEAAADGLEIDTVAVFGGLLTEVDPSAAADDTGKLRWCSVKEKELLVFSDSKASDPLRKMPLLASVISNLSDPENNVHRLKVRHGNDSIVLDACDNFDLNRWLRMLTSATERRNSSEDERPKCVGRLTSPTFAKKKLLVRRTRSEAVSQQSPSDSPTTTESYTGSKEHSASSTDRLMTGYLQQVREIHGARTLLRRWCVATSEAFIVYDNQNSKKASFEWPLAEMTVEDHSDLDLGSFGFCVLRGEEKLRFQIIDEDSARHWLSVLSRYCHTVAESHTVGKPPAKSNSLRSGVHRRSASDNDLKTKKTEKETNALEVLSEGRASGKKLMRRVSEDSSFFRKFGKPDLFKTPRRGSTEKLNVKLREKTGGGTARNSSKRFSCGSLFDSEGKYSGHLMELITRDLYSSQVRRWCLQRDDFLYVYEHEAADKPVKVIPLYNAKVVDKSDMEGCVYRFRIDYGDDNTVFFRALTRTDLEKWTTVISVKTAVLQDRSERQLRRSRTFSLEKNTDATGSSESEGASPNLKPPKTITARSGSFNETVSICSADSVFGPDSDNTAASAGVETVSTSSTDLESLVFTEKVIPSFTAPKELDDANLLGERLDEDDRTLNSSHQDNRTFSEPENADVNRKTVSNLSEIEDLSHIYENFLAFASAMVERSPEFQKQLYHIYENVSNACGDAQLSDSVQSQAGTPNSDSATMDASTEGELGSPSTEMSSEFEKISLREKEDTSYRYSGICGESELENLDESFSERERSTSDSVTESLTGTRNESSDEDELIAGKLAGETVAWSFEEKALKGSVSSGDEEDLLNKTLVGELLSDELMDQEEACSRKEEENVAIGDEENEELEVEVSATLNSILNDVVASVEESADMRSTGLWQPRDEDEAPDQESESDLIDKPNSLESSVVHDGCMVIAVEGEENSFCFVKETHEQVWTEILNATHTSTLHDVVIESDAGQDRLVSTAEEWTAGNEGEAMNVEEQGVELQNTHEHLETDSSSVVATEEDELNKNKEARSDFSETVCDSSNDHGHIIDPQAKNVAKELPSNGSQTLDEDVTLVNEVQFNSQESFVVDDSSSSSLPVADNNVVTTEAEGVAHELVTHKLSVVDVDEGSNSVDSDLLGVRDMADSMQTDDLNVLDTAGVADSLQTDLPVDGACTKEEEVNWEQSLVSYTYKYQLAQTLEATEMCMNENASTRTQNFEHENRLLLVAPDSDVESKDSTHQETCPEVETLPELVSSGVEGGTVGEDPTSDSHVMCLNKSVSMGTQNFEHENRQLPVEPDSTVGSRDSSYEETCPEVESSVEDRTVEEVPASDGHVMCMSTSVFTTTQNCEHEDQQLSLVTCNDVESNDSTLPETYPESASPKVECGTVGVAQTLDGHGTARTENFEHENQQFLEALENDGSKDSTQEEMFPKVESSEVDNGVEEGVLGSSESIDTGFYTPPNEPIVDDSEHEAVQEETCSTVETYFGFRASDASVSEVEESSRSSSATETVGEIQPTRTESGVYLCDVPVGSESYKEGFELERDVNDSEETVQQDSELRREWSSANNDSAHESDSDLTVDSTLERGCLGEKPQRTSQELIIEEKQQDLTEHTNVILTDTSSERGLPGTHSETGSNERLCDDSPSVPVAPATLPDPPTDSLNSWSHSSNLDDAQDLTKSQIDILKAVTAAFEEILELHGDGSEPEEDTRL